MGSTVAGTAGAVWGRGPFLLLPFLCPAAWGETGCHRRRQNESGPELPLSPGALGGAGPQCGGRAGGQRDPRSREGVGGGGRRVNGRRANMADSAACEW